MAISVPPSDGRWRSIVGANQCAPIQGLAAGVNERACLRKMDAA